LFQNIPSQSSDNCIRIEIIIADFTSSYPSKSQPLKYKQASKSKIKETHPVILKDGK
jgi:hypothetical protein